MSILCKIQKDTKTKCYKNFLRNKRKK